MELATILPGTLYVVATPIGNRQDISERAVEVLRSVNLIAAEDTRHSRRLLNNLGITARLVSCHDFSSRERLHSLLDILRDQQSIALISDAGTPAISDPGFELVRMTRQEGLSVIPIPGPSAVIAALSVSGIPSDRFVFEGFLPARRQARKARLELLQHESRTLIFYESPHRIVDSLEDLLGVLGPARELYIGRELTKKFETSYLGDVAACLQWIKSDPVQQKGEFVLVLAGVSKDIQKRTQMREGLRVLQLLSAELPLNRAAKIAAEITGASKNALYRVALQNQSDES